MDQSHELKLLQVSQDAEEDPKLELLPCPFCGFDASIRGDRWGEHRQFFAHCTSVDCFCCLGEGYDRDAGPDHAFTSEADAAAAWNRRAAEPATIEQTWTHAKPLKSGYYWYRKHAAHRPTICDVAIVAGESTGFVQRWDGEAQPISELSG